MVKTCIAVTATILRKRNKDDDGDDENDDNEDWHDDYGCDNGR